MSLSSFSDTPASKDRDRPDLVYLHKYDQQAAAYRYRFAQFYNAAEQAGYNVQSQSLLTGHYLREKYSGKAVNFGFLIWAYLRRIYFLFKLAPKSFLIIYMEALPAWPFKLEHALALKNRAYAIELDDAIFLNYERSKNFLVKFLLRKKFRHLFANARFIITGNKYLADWARNFNDRIEIIPTVVDLEYYRNTKATFGQRGKYTIGWMGSPSTARNLIPLKNVFVHLHHKYNCRFLFVGTPPLPLGEIDVEYRNWRQEYELQDLLDMDIGIMPLEKNEWNLGKCGFKLIQYMACGIPSIASPVGVNCDIIENGVNGFTALHNDEWIAQFAKLLDSPNLFLELGAKGRQTVVQRYSLQSIETKYIHMLNCYVPLTGDQEFTCQEG